jgi:hypothetical protein
VQNGEGPGTVGTVPDCLRTEDRLILSRVMSRLVLWRMGTPGTVGTVPDCLRREDRLILSRVMSRLVLCRMGTPCFPLSYRVCADIIWI